MRVALRVFFYEDANELALHRVVMIARGLEDHNGRTIFALAVLTRSSEAVDIYNATVPASHNWKPRFNVSAQNLVLFRSVRIQVPNSAERLRHRSLSDQLS